MLPTIPAKRYFTIGEVAELCDVKPHVLRYWEQEFTQLRPIKRRGNRRYYQHHEVLMIRRIRDLLYGQGFTISGARNRLQEASAEERNRQRSEQQEHSVRPLPGGAGRGERGSVEPEPPAEAPVSITTQELAEPHHGPIPDLAEVRRELLQIRQLMTPDQ